MMTKHSTAAPEGARLSITRRLFLRQTAAVGATVAAAAAVSAEQAHAAPTPDERIAAAIEEIKAAFLEKWSNAPLRIRDQDNGTDGMLLILSHVSHDKPGTLIHERVGRGYRERAVS